MYYFNTLPFLALWLLQVYPLKATQTINQNSIPSHSIWIYSLAGKHTAFIDADGGDIYLCRGEETTLCMWIYAFRQVAVCRQETPIKRFYWSCLETHSVLHIYRGTVIFFEGKYRGKSLESYDPQVHHYNVLPILTHIYGHLNWAWPSLNALIS